MTPQPASSLTELFEAAASAARSGRGLPPVHLWSPSHCGEIDILIRKDGTWVHEGSPIGRPELVRLFSTVLRRDGDEFFLVTPVEKLGIRVEDAPFLAVGVEREDEVLRFVTNVGDLVEAGPDNPIRVAEAASGEPRPYLDVRAGLQALIARPVFYELAAMAEARDGRLGVVSRGCWFDLGPGQ